MSLSETEIAIEFLDHVAIRVADLDRSSNWYQHVLGLKKYQLPEWGVFPIFLLAGKSGIALFPANENEPSFPVNSKKNAGIDHFAFHVTKENFEKAKKRYSALHLDYKVQDHYYFDSLYTQDPDGHTVELTTLKVSEKEFYK